MGHAAGLGWKNRIGLAAALFLLLPGCSNKPILPRSSDWVAALPDGEMKRKFIVGCTPCHQAGLPVAFKLTEKDWEETYVKMKKFDDELELRLIPFKPGELSKWLAQNAKMPKEGARIRTSRAKFKEYPLGPLKSFYHDMALAGGRAWIADYFGNVLYGVDPKTGKVESYPIPVSVPKGKPGGAHAIDVMKNGDLWVCFTKSEQVGRFDTTTHEWKMYSGYPKGGNTQYFVLDKDRFIYEDPQGCIWTTHFSMEGLCRLDPKTGKITVFKTPRTPGFPENGVHLYAAVADSKGRLWYTETHGNRLGVLDPSTGKAEEFEPFMTWAGPKRLAIDDKDRLWIPQLASGHITLYDTVERKVLREIPLPVPGDYTYGIRRNRFTGDLWVTGSGSDSLYRLDPDTFRFKVYRLPRAGAYTRTMVFEENGDVWTDYASFPNAHTQMPHQSGVILRMTPKE